MTKCTCSEHREVNAHRGDGTPIALWDCPVHGNVFEERQSDITLTPLQEEVLKVIYREREAGRAPSADEISRITNRSPVSVEKAMAVLQAINFIKPNAT